MGGGCRPLFLGFLWTIPETGVEVASELLREVGEHIGGGERARPGKVFLAGFPHYIQGGTRQWENLINAIAHC